jgi:putative phage-type endonuclease
MKDCNEEISITYANCTCPIGVSGSCGHVTGTLYQIAKLKHLKQRVIPADAASTSLPQTWHAPRGQKIGGTIVDNLEVRGYSKAELRDIPGRSIQSTLYDPLRSDIKWNEHYEQLKREAPEMLMLDVIKHIPKMVPSKFGLVPAGSVLSYQQRLDDNIVLNIYDGVSFPDLPVNNVVENCYQTVLTSNQTLKLESLKLSQHNITKFEISTRLQNRSSLWYKLRRDRVTASNIGDIFKRKKNESTLVKRLKSTRHVTTAAMRQGIALEPTAANEYAKKNDNQINLYPCGLIICPKSPWLAASPDRKVYNPQRFPPFGLLEIKCPQVSSVIECKYLIGNDAGQLKLKRNHNYYYQILTQLAVSGLDWCDLFVWCTGDSHQETIYLNRDIWNSVKNEIDMFYFDHFI